MPWRRTALVMFMQALGHPKTGWQAWMDHDFWQLAERAAVYSMCNKGGWSLRRECG